MPHNTTSVNMQQCGLCSIFKCTLLAKPAISSLNTRYAQFYMFMRFVVFYHQLGDVFLTRLQRGARAQRNNALIPHTILPINSGHRRGLIGYSVRANLTHIRLLLVHLPVRCAVQGHMFGLLTP